MTGALDPKVVEQWREGIPLKRGGTPADVANACVFLGSDLSANHRADDQRVRGDADVGEGFCFAEPRDDRLGVGAKA